MAGRIMAVATDEERIGELFPEELIINSHATIAGYLLLGVRGLGLLVLTWSTVVLLGGFVSTLGKKDFWCLTVITLVQATRVFDVTTIDISLNGNMFTQFGFFEGFVLARIRTWGHQGLWGLRGNLLYAITALVLRVVYATLFAVYVFGQHACTVISLARLIQRDYGDDSGNLKPALDLLYSISVLQGLLYILRKAKINNIQNMHHKSAAEIYKLKDDKGMSPEFIVEYTNKIIKTSDNDPVLFSSDQMNLVTYAVDRLKSEDAEECVEGARVLDRLIGLQDPGLDYDDQYMRGVLLSQRRMIKLLLTRSGSSLHHINKLLHALGRRSQYSTEMRLHAARIVAFIAHEIDLELFPAGIRHISSLLKASPQDCLLETYELDWQIETFDELDKPRDPPRLAGSGHSSEQQQDSDTADYRDLVLQGLRILRRLATNKDNIRIIDNTEGLLDMIMAPLTSDVLHCIGHGDWSTRVVEGSLRVVCTLSSPDLGKTGMKLRGEISSNQEAIKTMYGILKCDECGAELRKQTITVLMNLSLDTYCSSSTGARSRENLVKVLLSYFTGDNPDHSLKIVAGRALVMLTLTRETSAITVLQEDGGAAVDNLIKILLHAENNSLRIAAAEILEHLCGHCAMEENYSEKLKGSMTHVIRKLLEEILRWGPTLEEAHSIMIQDGNHRFSSPENDIEDQSRGLSEAAGQQDSTSQQEMNEKQDDMKLQVELLSLCVKVCDTFSLHLDAVAPGSDAANIPWKLKEVVERNDQPTADCLTILKQTFKMAISMVKHANRYDSEGLERLIESLFKASESMMDLEISMVFDSSDHITKPDTTLASLAKEARELLEGRKAHQRPKKVLSTGKILGIPL